MFVVENGYYLVNIISSKTIRYNANDQQLGNFWTIQLSQDTTELNVI